jgi:protein-tyrosine phosphatase
LIPKRRKSKKNFEDLKESRYRYMALPSSLSSPVSFGSMNKRIESIVAKRYVCYQDTDWLLIEFTRRIIDTRVIDDAVYELSRMGVNCLIAHPERYFDNEKQAVDTCKKWKALGCHFQINRTSLMGTHGSRADKISWRLVEEGFAHIVASDAHQGEGRRECRSGRCVWHD